MQVGVDPGMMTWAHLMGNLVPWDSFALVRHSRLVGIGWVGLSELAAQIVGFAGDLQVVGTALFALEW